MTMHTISDVPLNSPLSKINPDEVGKFYMDVTSIGFLQVNRYLLVSKPKLYN